jgi:hypothetical protein
MDKTNNFFKVQDLLSPFPIRFYEATTYILLELHSKL